MYTMQGKTRPTQHVRFSRQSMYARRTLPAGGPRTWQPFMSHRQSWTESLLLRKRAPDTIHSMPTDRSVGPYPVSLPSQPMNQWRKTNIYQQQATRQTSIDTFNTCSRGPTHQCLTDTGRGYNLGGADLPHTTPRPSRLVVSPLHLRVPSGLQFNQALTTKPKC
jgi:hypothetical protein